jgi:hypothetical protein
MKHLPEFTVEKTLRYLFLVLTFGAGLLTLLNVCAYLGISDHEPMIRGWVNYGHAPVQPEQLPMESGKISIYNMSQIQFAVIRFDSIFSMLKGIPLVFFFFQVLLESAVVLVLYELMQIFKSLDKGEVFRLNNLGRMRRIAYAVLAYSVLTFLNTNLLATFIQRSGENFRSAYPALTYERVLLGTLVSLIIFALLKAFKLGTQLQQEQDLTI